MRLLSLKCKSSNVSRYNSYKGQVGKTVKNLLLNKVVDEENHKTFYERHFKVSKMNEVWCTDVTEFKFNEEGKKEDVRIEGPDAVTWEVYTLEGLYMWAEEARTSSGASFRVNLKLLADIYMTEPWVPVDFTAGTIDGQGHTIYNMVIEGDKNLGFLLKTNQYIEVGNLNFENVRISGTTNLGVVAGSDSGSSLISNCHVLSGSVSGTTNIGGIIGVSTYYTKYYVLLYKTILQSSSKNIFYRF